MQCGRTGKQSFNSIGNRRFRLLITMYLERYRQARSKLDKSLVVIAIVDTIRSCGGGFVKQDRKTKKWIEIGDQLARDKVGHSLRDTMAAAETQGQNTATVFPETSAMTVQKLMTMNSDELRQLEGQLKLRGDGKSSQSASEFCSIAPAKRPSALTTTGVGAGGSAKMAPTAGIPAIPQSEASVLGAFGSAEHPQQPDNLSDSKIPAMKKVEKSPSEQSPSGTPEPRFGGYLSSPFSSVACPAPLLPQPRRVSQGDTEDKATNQVFHQPFQMVDHIDDDTLFHAFALENQSYVRPRDEAETLLKKMQRTEHCTEPTTATTLVSLKSPPFKSSPVSEVRGPEDVHDEASVGSSAARNISRFSHSCDEDSGEDEDPLLRIRGGWMVLTDDEADGDDDVSSCVENMIFECGWEE